MPKRGFLNGPVQLTCSGFLNDDFPYIITIQHTFDKWSQLKHLSYCQSVVCKLF